MAKIGASAPLGREHWHLVTETELFERLVAKAHELLSDKYWGNGAIPDGTTAESLALDTVEDVLLGTAAWDPLAQRDPYPLLSRIVQSKVANLVRSYRNRQFRHVSSENDEPGRDPEDVNKLIQNDADLALWRRAKAAVADSPELSTYIDAAATCDTRAEIAEALGISASEVTNRQKRVRRLFASLRADFTAPQFARSQK